MNTDMITFLFVLLAGMAFFVLFFVYCRFVNRPEFGSPSDSEVD